MNDLQISNRQTNISTNEILAEINKVKNSLLDSKDIVSIKGKNYINKRGYRKIAVAFSISTKIINEVRITDGDNLIYDFTVRATTPIGRYTEASASCSSEERDFNNLNNEVRAISQTRATNRAISDLVGLGEVSYEEINIDKNNDTKKYSSDSSNQMVTQKQRNLLIKLVESKYDDEHTRNALYKKIDSLTKDEARNTIKGLIEEGVEI